VWLHGLQVQLHRQRTARDHGGVQVLEHVVDASAACCAFYPAIHQSPLVKLPVAVTFSNVSHLHGEAGGGGNQPATQIEHRSSSAHRFTLLARWGQAIGAGLALPSIALHRGESKGCHRNMSGPVGQRSLM
jgi:hypothetical protein